MKLDDIVLKEVTRKPPRCLFHGVEGIGKSTYAATCPSPIFIPVEDGMDEVLMPNGKKPPSFPCPETFEDVVSNINMLLDEKNEYKTLVLDTIDSLEQLIWDKVCKDLDVSNISVPGWQKGYGFALTYWRQIMALLKKLRNKGFIIILIAHTEIRTHTPPDLPSYDRYQAKIHKKALPVIEETVDAILFMNYEIYVDKGSKKATGGVTRIIKTERRPAFTAKNRYKLPAELPMTNFNDLAALIKKVKK
ncbi:MAG: ATP-binding protein [Methanosarcinaceae archaeon]